MDIKERISSVKIRVAEMNKENEFNLRTAKKLKNTIDRLSIKTDEVRKEVELDNKTASIYQKISNDRNLKARVDTEAVINGAMGTIFSDKNYKIIIDEYDFSTRYKHTRLVLDDNGVVRDLKKSNGNALKQIVSVLSNLTFLTLSGKSRFLFLDETFNGLHSDKMKLMSELLISLRDNNDFQFFVIDHDINLFRDESIMLLKLGTGDEGELKILSFAPYSTKDLEEVMQLSANELD